MDFIYFPIGSSNHAYLNTRGLELIMPAFNRDSSKQS